MSSTSFFRARFAANDPCNFFILHSPEDKISASESCHLGPCYTQFEHGILTQLALATISLEASTLIVTSLRDITSWSRGCSPPNASILGRLTTPELHVYHEKFRLQFMVG